jgi:hypothetical protein
MLQNVYYIDVTSQRYTTPSLGQTETETNTELRQLFWLDLILILLYVNPSDVKSVGPTGEM